MSIFAAFEKFPEEAYAAEAELDAVDSFLDWVRNKPPANAGRSDKCGHMDLFIHRNHGAVGREGCYTLNR